MENTLLIKILDQNNHTRRLLDDMLDTLEGSICIQDLDGHLLFGELPGKASEKYPVSYEAQDIGWVVADKYAKRFANLLSYMVKMEAEERSLATEVLNRYRELNMLYHLSENLAVSLRVDDIAAVAIQEACRLIPNTTCMVVLTELGDNEGNARVVQGAKINLDHNNEHLRKIIDHALQNGEAEFMNRIPEMLEGDAEENGIRSIIIAPLKASDRVIGGIVLASDQPERFSAGDLKLLNSIASQTVPFMEIARLHQAEIQRARMEHELQMALQVQVDLLPETIPNHIPGWSFAANWRPALEVAGDFYDFIPSEDGTIDLVIADVADKGMPAALIMAFTRAALRASLVGSNSPLEGIIRTNNLVSKESTHGLFITLFLARLDLESGEMIYVNAGHHPPMHLHSEGEEIANLNNTGIALGVEPHAGYKQNMLRLNTNDLILFYTDGVTEAFNSDGDEFGEDRLQDFLHQHRHESAEDIANALAATVDEFIAPSQPSDDLTILVIKRL